MERKEPVIIMRKSKQAKQSDLDQYSTEDQYMMHDMVFNPSSPFLPILSYFICFLSPLYILHYLYTPEKGARGERIRMYVQDITRRLRGRENENDGARKETYCGNEG